jgi:hypothetical protein
MLFKNINFERKNDKIFGNLGKYTQNISIQDYLFI